MKGLFILFTIDFSTFQTTHRILILCILCKIITPVDSS